MTRILDVHWLSVQNADRTCEDCSDPAAAYLRTDQDSTRFICKRHLKELI